MMGLILYHSVLSGLKHNAIYDKYNLWIKLIVDVDAPKRIHEDVSTSWKNIA